jgi:hypothetical protein
MDVLFQFSITFTTSPKPSITCTLSANFSIIQYSSLVLQFHFFFLLKQRSSISPSLNICVITKAKNNMQLGVNSDDVKKKKKVMGK